MPAPTPDRGRPNVRPLWGGNRIGGSIVVMNVVLLGVVVWILLSVMSGLIDRAQQSELQTRHAGVQQAIAGEIFRGASLAALVASMPSTIKAMESSDRASLSETFLPTFDALNAVAAGSGGVAQFQFHKPPATSFLRIHQPGKFGDDLSSFRHTVIAANARRESVSGLEYGVAGLGIRAVAPIGVSRETGTVEFGLSFGKSFFDRLKGMIDADLQLFIPDENGAFTAYASTLDGKPLSAPDKIAAAFAGVTLDHTMTAGETPYAIRLAPVSDFSGRIFGVLELAMNARAHHDQYRLALEISVVVGVAAVLLAIGLAMFLRQVRATEAALRESEEWGRAILNTAVDAIITADIYNGGNIVEFNPAAERIFGYRRADVIGRPLTEVIIPSYLRAAHNEGVRRLVAKGDSRLLEKYVELEAMRSDGSIFPVELTISFMPFKGRQVFTAYARDITERHKAEVELSAYRDRLEDLVAERTAAAKAAEERLTKAINTFKGGFALYDADERLVIINDALATFMPEVFPPVCGISRLEEVTRAIAAANGLGEAWVQERLSLYRGPEEFSAERQLVDGRWIETTVRHTPDGSTLFVMTDITPYKEATAALGQALEKERELGQLQREFVSMTSHEFRTPLAIIDASAQRVLRRRETLSGEEFVSLMQEIRLAVSRMVGLIDAILTASWVDSGTIKYDPKDVDLGMIITRTCDRQAALSPAHRFAVDMAALPPRIVGDETFLDQIATNLVSNAVKYSPAGGVVEVKGWVEDEWAAFLVEDHGVGIPADEVPRLFQRFFRARTSTGIPGTGIGLHIVKRLAEMHGGTVGVTSVEGKGTTITVRLPISPVHIMEQGRGP